MIRLNLQKEPYWIDLADGIRIRVSAASTAIVSAGRALVKKDDKDFFASLLRGVAQVSILEWEGVGDKDGNPAPVTDEYIKALMDVWPLAVAFEEKYFNPAIVLEQEKNG
jgi:hypothetical protein